MNIALHFIKWGTFSVCIVLCAMLYAQTAWAASLLITAPSATVVAGNIVTVRIAVDAGGQAINTAEGTLQFPTDILQALSINQSSSVFSIWVQNPSFSNDAGTVTFSGGLPSPGYSGSSGTVLTVSFLAQKPGAATLSLTNADVRANDGLGTDVLQSTGTLALTVVSAPTPAPAPTPAANPAPTTPASAASTTPATSPSAATASAATTTLEVPLIIKVTSDVPIGGVAEVTGTSIYPGATVDLSLQSVGDQPSVTESTVQQNGSFTLTSPQPMPPGQYTGFVTVTVNGVQSGPSTSFAINFEGISLIDRLIGILNQTISLVILGILSGLLLGFVCGYVYVKARYRTPVRETLRDVELEIHKAFLTLRSHINSSLDDLEKKSKAHKLTDNEKEFVGDLVGNIKETEKEIEKDVRHPET